MTREDEPGRRLANGLLGNRSGIKCRGAHVIQDDGSSSPEGNKAEHGRGDDEHFGARMGRAG